MTLTYDHAQIRAWMIAAEHAKNAGRNYYGDRPCLPADKLMEVCRRIARRKAK